jgi:hypothetical protein
MLKSCCLIVVVRGLEGMIISYDLDASQHSADGDSVLPAACFHDDEIPKASLTGDFGICLRT